MRHAGLLRIDETLHVFWSRVGDAPEAILVSEVDLSPEDWNEWRATAPRELMRSAQPWEGGTLEILPSLRGEIETPVHELRDPFVFAEEGQPLYLFYVGAGEQAIGLARLRFLPSP